MGLTEAAAGVGRAVLGVYEKQRERADNAALQEAKVKVADWRANWNDPNNPKGVSAYKGKDALGLRDAMLADYKKTVGDIATSMNPRVRREFMPYADQFGVSVHEDINNYSNREHEGYLKQTHDAYVATAVDGLSAAKLKSDDAFNAAWDDFKASETKYAQDNGIGDEVLGNYLKTQKSAALMGTFDRLRATSDAYAARDFLDHHADEMTFDDVTKARGTIRQEVEAQQGIDDGDAVYNGQIGSSESVYEAIASRESGGKGNWADDGSLLRGPAIKAKDGSTYYAYGKYQLTEDTAKATAKSAGIKWDSDLFFGRGDKGAVEDYHDRLGRAHIDANMREFGGDPVVVAAAHNMGAGAAKAWAAGKPYQTQSGKQWNPKFPKDPEAMPAETRNYIQGLPGSSFAGRVTSEAEIRDRAIAMFGNTERGRNAAEAATRRYAMDKRDEAQRDGDMLDAMREAVAKAPPGTPVASIIGDRKDYASGKGWMGTLDAIANARDRDALVQTNPVVYDQFARMAAQFPHEFGTPENRVAILKHAGELATDDLNRLLDANTQFGDPQKGQKAMDDWATESQRLDGAYRSLGIDGKGKKDQQAAFASLYRRSLRTMILSQPQGYKPTPKELDALTQSLVASFHRDPEVSTRNALAYDKAATTGVTLDDGRKFTGQDVADMQAALRRAGKPDGVADAVNALGNYR